MHFNSGLLKSLTSHKGKNSLQKELIKYLEFSLKVIMNFKFHMCDKYLDSIRNCMNTQCLHPNNNTGKNSLINECVYFIFFQVTNSTCLIVILKIISKYFI